MVDYKRAKAKAEEVLKENFVVSPPIDIEDLVTNYGLQVVEVDFDLDPKFHNVAGLIDPKEKTIFVSNKDSETRKAFTIAHELGHWLLHQEKLQSEPEKYSILYRIPIGTLNSDPVEKEANTFAANLLVPKHLLDKYKDLDVDTISRIFGVSPEVVGYRLKNEYGRTL